jgi:molecular chaperone HtpG
VLAIYFHDLGLLVTSQEFDQRFESEFSTFCEKVLFAGDDGPDYRAKVDALREDRRDRFLYQEFVRTNHAARVRDWIIGRDASALGHAAPVVKEVTRLLTAFDSDFRRDLAFICESHHLADLDNLAKYKPIKPYGNSDAETGNLQYAAILLRACDLLHITRDRTPSIQFRAINPADPISQEEWAKQLAVKRVRDKWGLNSENQPDKHAFRDTIAVHATFEKVDGFFGLTAYLRYAEEQIRKCFDWTEIAKRQAGTKHDFPWRPIDQTSIEATGFIPLSFRFTIDERKILDLLTGHTLYNDTDVVLRELVQNSLDAVRLQFWSQRHSISFPGYVWIHWDSGNRVLTVGDNGTGMSQKIIENHLLRVGSSRYQDPDFKRNHPDFTAISRFGIGVLSTFMIADEVEIVTSHSDDQEARQLTLRSVHGKYLIRLLDKASDPAAIKVGRHGTIVRLRLRPTAQTRDVCAVARKWVVVPDAKVEVKVDDGEPIRVGHSSPKDGLAAYLIHDGYDVAGYTAIKGRETLKIVEYAKDGITAAFVVRWSAIFQEWEFYLGPELGRRGRKEEEDVDAIGTCIEGIRVDFGTPGYDGKRLVALVNCTGVGAPQTNVARSSVDWLTGAHATLACVYDLYCKHVVAEFERLSAGTEYSLTWAIEECGYLLDRLLLQRRDREYRGGTGDRVIKPVSEDALREAVLGVPSVVVEREGVRIAETGSSLRDKQRFWTIDSPLVRSAELIIREARSAVSISQLQLSLFPESGALPKDDIVCGRGLLHSLFRPLLREFEVDTIRVIKEQRRVDCRWARRRMDNPAWWDVSRMESDRGVREVFKMFKESGIEGKEMVVDLAFELGEERVSSIFFQLEPLSVEGLEGIAAVRTYGKSFVLFDEPERAIFGELISDGSVSSRTVLLLLLAYVRSHISEPAEDHKHKLIEAGARVIGRTKSNAPLATFEEWAKSRPIRLFSPDHWLRPMNNFGE